MWENLHNTSTSHTEKHEWRESHGRPHILEGEDDSRNDPNDHERNGGDAEKSPAGGEVHLQPESSHSREEREDNMQQQALSFERGSDLGEGKNKRWVDGFFTYLSRVASDREVGCKSYPKMWMNI